MRILRSLFVLLLAGLVALVGTPASAPAAPVPTLVAIHAAHHRGFDRVVFEFAGGLPSSRQVRYVDQLIGEGSGLPVRVAGRAVLQVRFEPADAHNARGATAPTRKAFALPNVMTAVSAGEFEAVTTYGIGLAKRTRFHVSTLRNPDRVVIDIRAAFSTVKRKVFFFNSRRFVANTEPFFTPRMRPVRPSAAAVGVLDRLFAGPVGRERARGLRLLRSRATGFEKLNIRNGIARVRLIGGCNSNGSTATIAGEIMPTLRQLASVDWVKIYDPSGHTASPTGRSDSIPDCLNP
ncbi:MAG TPA: hypothetical protein VK204_15965 [Nocardioidaceae bacterium]|nr:hypothetical protein [Nocardioidaceae bacterium]